MKQWLKELFHNCICHPLLPFLPRKFADSFHDKNGKWTFGDNK
jgi:hypothetical protein